MTVFSLRLIGLTESHFGSREQIVSISFRYPWQNVLIRDAKTKAACSSVEKRIRKGKGTTSDIPLQKYKILSQP